MTKITLVLPDMDDCDRHTMLGLIADTMANDDRFKRALDFRNVRAFEVRDDEPLTMADGPGGVLTVHVGFPATVDVTR